MFLGMDTRRYACPGRVVLSLALLLSIRVQGQAQPGFSLKLGGNITLDSLTSYLHTHSRLRFSFNSRKVRGNRVIHFTPGLYDRRRLLATIHAGTGLFFFVVRDHVIFQDNPPPGTPATKTVHPASASRDMRNTLTTPDLAPTAPPADIAYPLDWPGAKPGRPMPFKPNPVPPPPPMAAAVGHRHEWYLRYGLQSADVMYLEPTLEVGTNPIQLVAGWATDWYVSGLKLGLGSVIVNRKRTQWQLTATVSFLKKVYPFDSAAVNYQYPVRGQLYRLDAWWCKKLGKYYLLKVAPGFDVLRTVYIVNGQPSAGINRYIYYRDPNTTYYLVKAPVKVFDTFDRSRPSNLKGWLTLSVGIYYQLPF